MGSSQQFSLRWNNYLSHITGAFDTLRSDEDLVDVTLSCEGKRIRAHKMLLSACSTYFRDLFKENPCQHPVIIFRNVKFEDLVALIDFMYQGEVNVVQEQLASFLTTAELLAVQGLSEGTKDSSSDGKELELPDSPMLPPEPEVQMSNSSQKKQQLSSTSTANVSSPVSFFPVDQRPDSPPSVKRRKWGNSSGSSSGVGAKNSGVSGGSSTKKDNSERDTERETERRRVPPPLVAQHSAGNSSPDPIEIIPVVPNLKMELPDYMDQEQDASSCSYSDSNQGGTGVSGGQQSSSRDTLPPMSQLLSHSGASTSAEGKQEPPDMYSTNSRDASLPPTAESLSASDISQILAKPGPSGESQNQDSLQGSVEGQLRKRKVFTIIEKMNIIREIEHKKSQSNICRDYNLVKSTVSRIWKTRDQTIAAFEKCLWKCNCVGGAVHKSVEEALLVWFQQQMDYNLPVSDPILQKKAEELAKLCGEVHFKYSGGWVDRFKARNNIV